MTRLLMGLGVMLSASLLSAQGLADDAFARHLVGRREGTGVYQGNTLVLTRRWTLEIGNRFLVGDMRVSMPGGGSFAALTFWRGRPEGGYDLTWMDASGRMQPLVATTESGSRLVFSLYLDPLLGNGAEWRRWEYEATVEDTYVERVLRQGADGWEPLTEFRFTRLAADP